MASRYCRFASKYCRMAGVAPAGSEDRQGTDIGVAGRTAGDAREYNIEPEQRPLSRLSPSTPRRAPAAPPCVRRPATVLERARRRSGARTHGAAPAGRADRARSRRPASRSTPSICSRSPPVPARSPACASASRRCRGWRWRRGLRDRAGLDARRARAAPAPSRRARAIAAWIDAQRGEVFAALYDPAAATVDARRRRRCRRPSRRSTRWTQALDARPLRFIGDGAVRYRDAIVRRALGERAEVRSSAAAAGGRCIGRIAAASIPSARVAPARRRPDLRPATGRRAGARAARRASRRRR